METKAGEDASGLSLDDWLNSKFPPEIAERIRSLLKSRQIRDLDELNVMLSEIMLDYNRRPRHDRGGLSPEQVHHLIHADWDDSLSVFHINRDMPLEQIRPAPILHDARVFLIGIIDAGGNIKTTVKGNLPRWYIHKMIQDFSSLPEDSTWLIGYAKALNERDISPIHIVRILLELGGLIRKQKGRFHITRQGEKLIQEKHAGELYARLFQIHFYHFNLAYLDGAPPNQALQSTIPYSFYRIAQILVE